MISLLSQELFELVEGIRFNADRLTAASFNYAEDARLLIHFVLANVNVLLDTVYRTSFEVIVRIQNPTRVNNKIDGN